MKIFLGSIIPAFILISLLIMIGVACDSNTEANGGETNNNGQANTTKGVVWLYDWEEAVAEAQARNTLIMVNFYTQVCPTCRVLDQNTFANEEVGNYLNKNFVCVKIDASRSNLSRVYWVPGVPITYFIFPDETSLGYKLGYASPEEFILIAQEALSIWLNEFKE